MQAFTINFICLMKFVSILNRVRVFEWVPRGSGAAVIQVILKVKMYQGHVLYSPEQGNDSTSSGFGFGGGARGLVVYLLYHRDIATYITIMRSCLIK